MSIQYPVSSIQYPVSSIQYPVSSIPQPRLLQEPLKITRVLCQVAWITNYKPVTRVETLAL